MRTYLRADSLGGLGRVADLVTLVVSVPFLTATPRGLVFSVGAFLLSAFAVVFNLPLVATVSDDVRVPEGEVGTPGPFTLSCAFDDLFKESMVCFAPCFVSVVAEVFTAALSLATDALMVLDLPETVGSTLLAAASSLAT